MFINILENFNIAHSLNSDLIVICEISDGKVISRLQKKKIIQQMSSRTLMKIIIR